MGDVWRAWDRRDQRYIAAKVLRQSDGAALLRFVRESSWRIKHPHVVMPTGWAGEDDLVLFAMPIISGGSIATVLGDHGTVPWSWARIVLDQVLQALGAVHDTGLVHRDVKPANILLQPTGTGAPYALLSDFGIAWHRDEPRLTRASEVVGTRGYQAPELALGAEPQPSHDLYSVGLLAQEMLGELPAGSVLSQLVEADPTQRPTSAAQVRTALAQMNVADRTNEPVEVFNQLPAWPHGWGPSGPEAERQADSQPAHARVLGQQRLAGNPAGFEPIEQAQAAQRPDLGPTEIWPAPTGPAQAGPGPFLPPSPETGQRYPDPPNPHQRAAVRSTPAQQTRPPRRRLLSKESAAALLLGVCGLALLVAAVLVL